PSNRLPASMLASNPVPSLNQNSQPLGIPYRFKTKQSRSRGGSTSHRQTRATLLFSRPLALDGVFDPRGLVVFGIAIKTLRDLARDGSAR
ncbi:MAG: hypothetical protein ACK5U4_07915, partial [Rhodospirillales bacterium]